MIVNYYLLHDYFGRLIEGGWLNAGSTFCNSRIPGHIVFLLFNEIQISGWVF